MGKKKGSRSKKSTKEKKVKEVKSSKKPDDKGIESVENESDKPAEEEESMEKASKDEQVEPDESISRQVKQEKEKKTLKKDKTKPDQDISEETIIDTPASTASNSKADESMQLDFLKDDDELIPPDLVEAIEAQKLKPREAWKILFSGLDFAGKSSILATIKQEFQKIVNPAPTKLTERAEFTFLGQEIAEWDMGGQRLYRVQYLKRPLVYYADTSVLFYVIDILDEERYEEAIDFLYDTLKIFDQLTINPLISVLFNKFDPEVEKESKKTRIELKINEIENKIKVLTYGRDILFFRTSIFNRYSVIEAFSETLLQLFPNANVVDYVLAELAVKTQANIIILLDENRLILGSNIIETEDHQYDELVNLSHNTLLSFLYLNENFKFYPFLKSSYIVIQLEKYSFLWSQVDEGGHVFNIIVFKEGADFNDLIAMDMRSVTKTLIKLVRQ